MRQIWSGIGVGVPVTAAALAVVAVLALVLAGRLGFRHGRGFRRGGGPRRRLGQAATTLGLAATVVLVLGITLSPTVGGGRPAPNLVPLVGLARAFRGAADPAVPVLNLVGNVLLFVPFGCMLRLRFRLGPGLAVVVGLALPATIEVVQGLVVPGRAFDVDDIIVNVVGVLSGVLLARLLLRLAGADRRPPGANPVRRPEA